MLTKAKISFYAILTFTFFFTDCTQVEQESNNLQTETPDTVKTELYIGLSDSIESEQHAKWKKFKKKAR